MKAMEVLRGTRIVCIASVFALWLPPEPPLLSGLAAVGFPYRPIKSTRIVMTHHPNSLKMLALKHR